jgi:predicted membrane protein
MGKRRLVVVGSLLTLYGIMLLVGQIFHIDIGSLCFPTFLILLGLYIIFGRRIFPGRPAMRLRLFPELRRSGDWQVTAEEIMMFVGDIRLDFSQAQIPSGETIWRTYGFVGSIRLIFPDEVGWRVTSTAFLTDAKSGNEKQEQFVSTYEQKSSNYDRAERKIHLDFYFFVNDLKIETIP